MAVEKEPGVLEVDYRGQGAGVEVLVCFWVEMRGKCC